ncbi:MAG: hypothetical protein FD157_304 [Rhodocyclaceae bacterium]|nr:MAG: hypothetical protein FD157_304 [Rhodocyclaceae bacterium]TND02555.1 MAG: hypothetical protein FD118_1919 [Rhodocyclaceae bacterium]
MGSNVLRFDFEEMTRLAKTDPEGFAHKRKALIRQLIDKAPRTEHLTELQRTLNQACYQFAAPSMQLGFHITDMMLQTASLMVAQMSTLNGLLQEASHSVRSRRVVN